MGLLSYVRDRKQVNASRAGGGDSAARALAAAQGPSLAPKGYTPDTAGRDKVHSRAGDLQQNHWDTTDTGPGTMQLVKAKPRREAYAQAAKDSE